MTKNLIKKIIFVVIILLVIAASIYIMYRYSIEGEKEMPFSLERVLIVSTVDGKVNDDPNNIWNIGVTQVNDIFIYINKTTDENRTIKDIKFQNFEIKKKPKMGKVSLLLPTDDMPRLYDKSQEDYMGKEFSYVGGKIDNLKDQEIANTGGVLGFRFSLNNLGNFVSSENGEVIYDGRLLSNLGLTIEDIAFSVGFDIIITTDKNVSYQSKMYLDLPIETVIEEGSSNKSITNFDGMVFKRVTTD